MSKIYIKEVDLTTVERASQNGTDVVYIPGFSSLANSTNMAEVNVPTLCNTIAEFETYFGTQPAVFASNQPYPTEFSSYAIPSVGTSSSYMFYAGDPDPSYIYAKELLALGIPVVYERVNTYANIEDAGSENYDVTVAKMYSFLSKAFSSSLEVTTETDIENATIAITASTFNSVYPSAGTYTLVAKTTATPTTTITDGNIRVVYDKYISKYTASKVFTASTMNLEASGTISVAGASVTVVPATFATAYPSRGEHVFTYSSSDSSWVDEDDNTVSLNTIGITVSLGQASLSDGTTITVTLAYNIIWKDPSNTEVNLNDIGIIIVSGVPVSGSTITVTLGSITTSSASWPDGNGILRAPSYFGMTISGVDSITPNSKIYVCETFNNPAILDKSGYSVKYITSGGYPSFEYSGRTISQAMATLASQRGDAIALIDHTNNPGRSLVGISSVYNQANVSTNVLSSATASYAAMFTPWGNYSLINNYSVLNTGIFALPPSFAYLSCLANSIASNPAWLAIAGTTRGKVSGLESVSTVKAITNTIADSYTPDNAVCVNPITNARPYGQCIWGNRTLVDNSTKGGTTALSFLNIRNLVCDIKKQCFLACQSLLFEQNTDVLWVNFLSLLTPLLDRMVSGYGMSNYKIIRENPSDKSVITAVIRIYPTYAVEAFDITLYLQNGDVEVEE